jgi:transposase-like protein
MSRFKNQKRDLGVRCPSCKSKDMVYAGYGMVKGYKLRRRYECKKCHSTTVKPIKV